MKKIRSPYNKPTIRRITEHNHTKRNSDPIVKLGTTADIEQGQRCAELWRAVLMQAINDAKNGNTSAQRWMKSDSVFPTSFAWCCSILNMEPNILRRELQNRMKELDKGDS